MGHGLGQHSLAAARGSIEQDSRRRRQQRPAMSVQMRHRQWVDDGLLELLDDVAQPTNVIKADWDIFRGDDFKGYLILVLVEN